MLVVQPRLAAAGSRPRLIPLTRTLALLERSPRMCRLITRFSVAEVHQLAADLLIDPRSRACGRWRYTPLHRLLIFLICLSNYWPSRKLSLATGWAANAVLNNWRYHIHQIISVLDIAGGGRCTRGLLIDRSAIPIYSLSSPCLSCQPTPSLNGPSPSRTRGSPTRRDQPPSATASVL